VNAPASRDLPTTVALPDALPVRRERGAWIATLEGPGGPVEVTLTNLDKMFWEPEGFTKADLVAYYAAIAPWALPYVRDRPLTLKRMPNGADGEFFYAKQAPTHTPPWVRTAPVLSRDTGKTIDYLLADNPASLVWLANLGCIELHPWHSRIDDLGRPDYAFFDLDPFDVDFATVRDVALHVKAILDQLGLRGYPRTSGATGMQVYVPLDRRHSYATVREWVGRVCRLINRADPEATTMEWQVSRRGGQVFLDHNMNTEGRNIAGTYSLRPERGAPVATPLRWDELETDVEPGDFTIATIWRRLDEVGDLLAPMLEGGQDLRAAMAALGMDPGTDEREAAHELAGDVPPAAPEKLATYAAKRDFAVTPEPSHEANHGDDDEALAGRRFVIQHHLATRLHHDLRLERDGVAVSWAVPKGLPDVPGVRHLAVQTEDHPLAYMTFEGEIPAGEYGGGPVRIWDRGAYAASEWTDGKVTFTLVGERHRGTFHLFRTGGDRDPSQWMVVRRDQPAPGELPAPPPQLAPMLAVDGGQAFDDPDWLFELKWDGVRAIATVTRPGAGQDGSTRLHSRAGNDITAGYPELAGLWERVVARNAVLDGELVAFDAQGRPSFERLQQRMHVRDAAAIERLRRTIPVVYLAFDLLAVDGELLVGRPLRERLDRLDRVLVPGSAVQRSEPTASEGVALFEAVREQGLEGLIAKRADSVYQPGTRSADWRKLKVRRRTEVVIGGWAPGERSRAGTFGALLIGLYDEGLLRFLGKVGTGFTDAELRRLRERLAPLTADDPPFADPPRERGAVWVRPELVCEVEYAEVTSAPRLRAPAYKGLRPELDPRTCLLDTVVREAGDRPPEK
jgi:bifunctional non-homologous end joining protein LigD